MAEYKYKFTVFTPCYNSAPYIDRIRETIEGQTYRDFEWIVVNDASTDNTSELLKQLIKTIDVPVKFFDLKKNQMLAANYNLAVEHAEGEIFVITGHDDIYLPNMLEIYNNLYNQYNNDKIGGVVGRCITQYGKVTPSEFEKPIMSYWDYGVDKKGNYTGEAPRAIKTEVLKKYMPFDPEEKLNPPIEELMACDGYLFITTNSIVRKYYYAMSDNSLCFSASKYRLHSWRRNLLYINKFQFYMPWPFRRRIKAILDYAYSSVQMGYNLREALEPLQYEKKMVIVAYPIAYLLRFIANHKMLHDLIIHRP